MIASPLVAFLNCNFTHEITTSIPTCPYTLFLNVTVEALVQVPGNLISCAALNPCCSTYGKAADLRRCHNLRRVLGLYPVEPIPDIAFHAPLLPTYVHDVVVVIVVVVIVDVCFLFLSVVW
jgi:hypothetical protein